MAVEDLVEIASTDTELLNDETEVVVEEEEEKPSEQSEDEEDQEKKKEEEKKKKEEEEDKRFPHERYSLAEIREKYPEIFKEFPGLRDSIFREIEYTKKFPTIEDAQDALEDSLALEGLRESVLAGKSEEIIEAIKATDEKAVEKFALTFLPTLYAKDNALYTRTISPILENLTQKLGQSRDENERNAAIVLARWLWGTNGDKIVEGTATFSKRLEPSEDEKKLQEERSKFQTEQFQNFQNVVIGEAVSERKKLISRGLDPDKSMTDSQKEMLIERIEKLVNQELEADKSHMSVMNARWLRSKREGFNDASKDKIVAAYLSRAKQVIPSIREKEKAAFLGTRSKAAKRKVEEIDNKSSQEKVTPSGRVTSSGNATALKPGRELYRKMSDIDILNQA